MSGTTSPTKARRKGPPQGGRTPRTRTRLNLVSAKLPDWETREKLVRIASQRRAPIGALVAEAVVAWVAQQEGPDVDG